jgi:hypothetical protein
MKQAALNTFAALAVAALCAGAVFVGYDYLQDDNDDAPSEVTDRRVDRRRERGRDGHANRDDRGTAAA